MTEAAARVWSKERAVSSSERKGMPTHRPTTSDFHMALSPPPTLFLPLLLLLLLLLLPLLPLLLLLPLPLLLLLAT